jgi:hypothetical protein
MQNRLIAGDSLNFTTEPLNYPASAGWTLIYTLIATADGNRITFTGTAKGDLFRVLVSSSTTAGWAPGAYTWAASVSKAGERYTVDTGELTIVADPAQSGLPINIKSQAQTALDAALAAFAAWDGTRKQISINGRAIVFNTPAEIIEVISFWEAEVLRERDAERIAAGLRSPRNVYVRFGNA